MAHDTDNPFPVDPTGPLTVGGIPDADLDALIAKTLPVAEVDEQFTYRDAMYAEDCTTVRLARGPVFGDRAFVRVSVDETDDAGDKVSAAVLLDAGTAVVMALDLLGAAAQAMLTDPGPFRRMTRSDHQAADAAIKIRRDWADK